MRRRAFSSGRGAFFLQARKNFPFPYADIHFDAGSFKVGGKTELGIIARLGDMAIESAELSSPGIAAIYRFKPAKTEAKIREQEEQINKLAEDKWSAFLIKNLKNR